MWRDLNSVPYQWARWGMFFNQLFWSVVALISLAAENPVMVTIGYFTAVIPAWIFLFGENVVPLFSPQNHYKMHSYEWIFFRSVIVAVTLILLLVWSGVRLVPLLTATWIMVLFTLFNEGLIVSDLYNTCCVQPYQTV